MAVKLHFALTKDKERIEPQKGIDAFCPACGAPLIARLGKKRAHHWAHKSICTDTWLSPETEWHLNWKNKFPKEWQEIRHVDVHTGEIHISDVKTPSGFFLEFQHSPIDEQEIQARESFYKNMLWVVDLHKASYRKLLEKKKIQCKEDEFGKRILNLHEIFPSIWTNRRSIICFDYMGTEEDPYYSSIVCLIPSGYADIEYIKIIDRKSFIIRLIDNSLVTELLELKEKIELSYKYEQTLEYLKRLGVSLNRPVQNKNNQAIRTKYKDMEKVKIIKNAFKRHKN